MRHDGQPVSRKMGAYLSEPITKKESSDEVGKDVAYGASSMQGWRISQEVSGKSCRRVAAAATATAAATQRIANACARARTVIRPRRVSGPRVFRRPPGEAGADANRDMLAATRHANERMGDDARAREPRARRN